MAKKKALNFYRNKRERSAKALVAKARTRASLTEAKALRIAVAETRRARVHSARRKTTGPTAKDLARLPGISWRGGKPKGIARGERLPRGKTVADLVIEDRR